MEDPHDGHNRQGRERFGVLGLGVRAPSADDWSRDCAHHGLQYAIAVCANGDVLGLEHRATHSFALELRQCNQRDRLSRR
jgi:hypothetical protein